MIKWLKHKLSLWLANEAKMEELRAETLHLSTLHKLEIVKAALGCLEHEDLITAAQRLRSLALGKASLDLLKLSLGDRTPGALKDKLKDLPDAERKVYAAEAAGIVNKRVFKDVIELIVGGSIDSAVLQSQNREIDLVHRGTASGALKVEAELQTLASEHLQEVSDAGNKLRDAGLGELIPKV